jgi:SpoIID/LytB domain protein
MKEPQISVGIVAAEGIAFSLDGEYCFKGKELHHDSSCEEGLRHGGSSEEEPSLANSELKHIAIDGNSIVWEGEAYEELLFTPTHPDSDSFALENVVIGIGFHWERHERQRFRGALRIIMEDGMLRAINIVGVEEYLTSVISSEMSATSSLELLKAHAVISRSWLMAQIAKKDAKRGSNDINGWSDAMDSQQNNEIIRWYDREDHKLFDVCADDHCQRYQGITRRTTATALEAVQATRGEVLTADGEICDARFSKCCGGAFEEFQYCWEPKEHSYLKRGLDRESQQDASDNDASKATSPDVTPLPDLTNEAEAEKWIRTSPEAFCNTNDKQVLSQVLNGYDRETADFYRWRVNYTQRELAELIRQRSGIDYGEIVDLKPVARGVSGRLWKLQIVGTKRTMTIGKELEIRRTLSHSHLYSSAFVVDSEETSPEGIPARFVITGAGWGHGVGLCQIGAAMMSERGYSYDEILHHYYSATNITKLY